MTPEYDIAVPARTARPLRNGLLIALLAFVLGAALVTWALTRWDPARRLLVPVEAAPAAVVAANSASAPLPSLPLASPSAEQVAVTESRVTGLEARIAQLDARARAAAANAARAEGLLIAFAARRSIDRGAPLGYIEGQVRERFAASQPRAVAAIIAAAQQPVTLDMLRQRLDALAPDLVGGGANEDWWRVAQRTLGTLVIVRQADTPSPAADERLARARTNLEAGQADTALAEIARLPARAKAAEWLAAARRYVEAQRALDILEAAAITTPPATASTNGTQA